MRKVSVSVIIPVYNTEAYLRRCIESVWSQTLQDWELICVDDGSTDGCLQVLEEYAARDPRIRIIRQENAGQAVARNRGQSEAVGTYLYFMDSDDHIHPQLLEICHHYAGLYGAQVVGLRAAKQADAAWAAARYELGSIPHRVSREPLALNLKERAYALTWEPWAKFCHRDILDGIEFPPGIKRAEDALQAYTVWARHPLVVSLKCPLYGYENRPLSITHTAIGTVSDIAEHFSILRRVLHHYTEHAPEDLPLLRREFIPKIINIQYKHCKKTTDPHTRHLMLQALAEELRYLRRRHMLSPRGHKLSRYLKYLLLLMRYPEPCCES